MNVFEQVNDMVVLDLDISGFEDLSEKQKKLSYHLSKAALWGNYISFVQGSKYNLMFLSDLKEVYQSEKIKEFPSFQQEIKSILFTLFFHGGVYHSTTGEKIDFNFSDSLKVFLDTHFQSFTHKLSFLNEMKQYRTVQNDEVDIVAESGGNHYQNLTTEEVKEYRKTAYNTELFGEKQPMFGLNEVLVKNQQTGEIVSHKIYKDGVIFHVIQWN